MIKGCKYSYPIPAPYGTIYSKTQWSDTSDFTMVGAGTLSLTGSYIETSGPNSILMAPNNIGYTCLDKQYQKMIINVGTVDSTNTGIGLGRKSRSITTATMQLMLNPFTGAVTLNGVASGSTTPPNNNDLIQLEAEFSLPNGTATFTVTNLTQPSIPVFTATYNYIIAYPPTGSPMPNTGYFAIFVTGAATITIQSYEISSQTLKNASIWVSGNSKSTGRFATTIPNGWAEKVRNKYTNVVNASGGGDTSVELLVRIPEIIRFSPRRVLLEIGSNDIRTGRTESSFESRYSNAVNQLESVGIRVYHMLTMPETAQNLTIQRNFMLNNFPKSRIINTWTPLVAVDGHSMNPIYIGDATGVHFNDLGHQLVYEKVIDFFGNSTV